MKSMTTTLLHQAEAFADASLRGVLELLPEDPDRPDRLFRDCTRLTADLEVHFLFPNLPISDRRLLADLLRAKAGMGLKRMARGRRKGGVTSAAGEKRYQELRERAVRLQEHPALTPAQKEVLEACFLGNAALNLGLDDVSHSR